MDKEEKKIVEKEVNKIMENPDFRVKYWGVTYKIGTHGFIYRWSEISEAWIKSDMELSTLRSRVTETVIRQRSTLLTEQETENGN